MSKSKRVKRNWPIVLSEYRGSGLSIREFCSKRGIKPSLFYKWRNRLGEKGHSGASAGFTELISDAPATASSGVTIRLGGDMAICLERGFDPRTLQAVMGALSSRNHCLQ